jgi:hypothetical protein
MTLAVVVAVLPRALANPGDGDPSFLGSSGEVTGGEDSGVLTQTEREQAQTDIDTQPPTNTDGATPPLRAQGSEEPAQPPTDVAQAQPDQTPDAQAARVPQRDDQAAQGGQHDAPLPAARAAAARRSSRTPGTGIRPWRRPARCARWPAASPIASRRLSGRGSHRSPFSRPCGPHSAVGGCG